jgi:hypothetical protein
MYIRVLVHRSDEVSGEEDVDEDGARDEGQRGHAQTREATESKQSEVDVGHQVAYTKPKL